MMSLTFGLFTQVSGSGPLGPLVFLFYPFFFFSLYYVNIKTFYDGVFSGYFKARMLKLGIHMDDELLYCGIEIRTPCSYSSLYLSIFLSFKAKFMSQFSPELCKLESSNVVHTYVE